MDILKIQRNRSSVFLCFFHLKIRRRQNEKQIKIF